MRMTTLLCLSLAGACAPTEALAQATFGLANWNTVYVFDAPVYDWTGNLLSGLEWVAEVYGGATPDSLSPVVGSYGVGRVLAPFVRPGYFRGDTYGIVPSVHEVGWAWLQVKVWDVQLGATYEEAAAHELGGYGQSSLLYAQGGGDNALQVPQPLIGLQSFSVLQPIPEPATGALLTLGGLGLWWVARRRQGGQP